MAQALEPGSLYDLTVTSWAEGAQYTLEGCRHEIVLFAQAASEVTAAIRRSRVELGVVTRPPALVLLVDTARAVPWWPAPSVSPPGHESRSSALGKN